MFFVMFLAIILTGSLFFSIPTIEQKNHYFPAPANVDINSENSYLVDNLDGTYSLYCMDELPDESITNIYDYSELPIK
ncbi:hypothetical protein LQZ18_10025 [Lachnospiraceae bacterium ZAX-1]